MWPFQGLYHQSQCPHSACMQATGPVTAVYHLAYLGVEAWGPGGGGEVQASLILN